MPLPPAPETIAWKSLTGMSPVLYIELHESGIREGTVLERTATRRFITPWASRDLLIEYFLGSVTVTPTGTTVIPPKPYPCPSGTVYSDLLAKRYKLKGTGPCTDTGTADTGGAGSVAYRYADITIEYDNVPLHAAMQPTVTAVYSIDVATQCLEIDNARLDLTVAGSDGSPFRSGFRWKLIAGQNDQDGALILDAPKMQKPFRIIEFTIMRPSVNAAVDPFVLPLLYQNRMNFFPFFGVPKHCCIYLGPSASGATTTNGVTTFDILHRFQAREVPWTHMYRKALDKWLEIDPPLWPDVLANNTQVDFNRMFI